MLLINKSKMKRELLRMSNAGRKQHLMLMREHWKGKLRMLNEHAIAPLLTNNGHWMKLVPYGKNKSWNLLVFLLCR